MNDSTPEKQPQRVPKSPNAQKEDNLVSVNSDELSAYNPRGTHPHSAPKEHLAPIHLIPTEILLHIIHFYVKGSADPVQDLSALTLVYQRWHAVVEDASSLWDRIDAYEGLAAVRKRLRMAKDAALHITYNQRHSRTDQLAFFEAIGERIDQSRSLVVDGLEAEHCCAILETTIPRRLETLHLSGYTGLRGRSDDEPLILFSGAAAPPGLRDVHLACIPGIAVTPLKRLHSFFLSALAAPHLQKLHIECNMRGNPASQLLNDDLVRLVPTLTSLISTASEIQVTSTNSFEWLCNHLGGHLDKLPFHLGIEAYKSNLAYLEWFTSRVVVTKLSLWASSDVWDFKSSTGEMVRLLSHPIPSSPTSWFLPDVEVLVSSLVWEGSHPEILEMIERRHSANREQHGGSGAPKKFKEIWLSCGNPSARKPMRPNVVFLKAVETAGEGADLYWEGKKWTSAGHEE
ncbi:hypothetical protein FRC04_011611 [Tulasnella sp. 424]|nr:hypothetical protein FRC04_011611 [Tulasnella sp. 424]KAG8967193.1 hypothetical protein FRC05_002268 [Tulasnella sp. 425]